MTVRGINVALFSSCFSADPERGVNDDGFFFLFLSAYLFSIGDEREYGSVQFLPSPCCWSDSCPCSSPGSPIVFMLMDRWREGVGVDSKEV